MNLPGVWNWLARNSRALEGAAALIIVLAAIPAGWRWIVRNYSSDLIVKADWNESTIPPDLSDWTRHLSMPLNELSEAHAPPSNERLWSSPLDRLTELSNSTTGKLLRTKGGLSERIGRLSVSIQNNTNETIPSLRMRVDRFQEFWGVLLAGDFLTEKEVSEFYQRVEGQRDYSSLVLPDLPPLPAHSLVLISLYGDGQFSEVNLAAPGRSSKIEKTIKIEDSWLTAVSRHPWVYAFPTLWIIVLGGPILWAKAMETGLSRGLPDKLYDFACVEAKAGNPDASINYLRKAFQSGYTDKHHARNDLDLSSLRELPEFKTLVGDS